MPRLHRAKATRVVPIETPWMLAQSHALACDPYHLELSPWPRGPVGRGSLDVPEPEEEPLDEVDERLAAAEQLAREETSERITAFRKPRKPRRNKQEMTEARAQRRIEDRGRQRAATSGTFLEGAAAEQEAWLRSIQDEALPT